MNDEPDPVFNRKKKKFFFKVLSIVADPALFGRNRIQKFGTGSGATKLTFKLIFGVDKRTYKCFIVNTLKFMKINLSYHK
jgi:hypothetical protein